MSSIHNIYDGGDLSWEQEQAVSGCEDVVASLKQIASHLEAAFSIAKSLLTKDDFEELVAVAEENTFQEYLYPIFKRDVINPCEEYSLRLPEFPKTKFYTEICDKAKIPVVTSDKFTPEQSKVYEEAVR